MWWTEETGPPNTPSTNPDDVPLTPSSPAALQGLLLSLLLYIICTCFNVVRARAGRRPVRSLLQLKEFFFSKFDCSFGSLNIPQNSPNLEYTSHPAKIAILHCHWVWSLPAGSVAPPIVLPCLPHVHRRTKFITQIHHEQKHKKVCGTDTVTPTGSQPF